MRGPPMPNARAAGQRACTPRSNKLASRSPDASPATIANCGESWDMRAARSAHDAALGGSEKVEHQRRVPIVSGFVLAELADRVARGGQREPLPVQQLVHLLD